MNRILDALRRATAESEPTDGQLLEAYSARRDGAAFAELVRRHGPMVWGVCRRILSNSQDAEDAFQATFLVLVRKPGSVRPAERVGSWLHGVAVRAARKAGKAVARRRERQVESLPEPTTVGEGVRLGFFLSRSVGDHHSSGAIQAWKVLPACLTRFVTSPFAVIF